MNSYTSCFIGIPLPDDLQNEFDELCGDVASLNPKFETVYSKTPHITLCYLNRESQLDLIKISELVKPVTDILEGVQVEIDGLGYFSVNNRIVIYLDVKVSKELIDFNQQVSQVLSTYSAVDNHLDFQPHITVGKLDDTVLFESFKPELVKLLAKRWVIPVTEIYLYGADSTVTPEFQEKIIGIEIGS